MNAAAKPVKKTRPKLTGAAALGPGPGRPPGVPNKLTSSIREMILQALEGAGGVEYLIQRAHDPKTAAAFLTLVGKVLPLQLTGGGPDGEHVILRVERVVVDPANLGGPLS